MAYKYSVGQPFVYPRNELDYASNFLHMCFSVPAEKYVVDPALARVTPSDRPDLADFQSNGALAAAKALKANPRELAAKVAEQHAGDEALKASAAQVAQDLAAYAKQADQAIDLASVDPNTGVAAMQGADASFKAAGAAMARLVDGIRAAAEKMPPRISPPRKPKPKR